LNPSPCPLPRGERRERKSCFRTTTKVSIRHIADYVDPTKNTVNQSPPSPTITMRIAGIDYGTKRVGIAMADLDVCIASPYETYVRGTRAQDSQYFCELVRQERLSRFVVGLPVHVDGHESQKSEESRRFGQWLQETTGLPVDYFDERYTSVEAEEILSLSNLTKKRRKARIDQLAAQIMLSAYLESGTRGSEEPQGLE